METTGMMTCDEVAVKKTEDGVTVKKADDGIATKKANDGIATKKVYDEVAVKKNKQNIIWLSIAFSFIYFGKNVLVASWIGINTYKNFAVPLLGIFLWVLFI